MRWTKTGDRFELSRDELCTLLDLAEYPKWLEAKYRPVGWRSKEIQEVLKRTREVLYAYAKNWKIE